MKTLLIAKRDFKSGFSTPRTGVLIFFLLGINAMFFASFIKTYLTPANPMMMGGGGTPPPPPIQEFVKGLIYNLQFLFMMIVPAVTMGTFAEEIKTRTIRFLQTAPVSSLAVVMGKFGARFATLLAAILLCSVFPAFFLIFGNGEVPVTVVSYLGLTLLVAFQVSFGVWVSSLTSQQFIAFLFTILGLFTFFILDFITPKLVGAGIVSNILTYLAPLTHFDNFLNGLITVEDVAYFLIVTVGFLFLAQVSYDSRRWR